MIKRIVTIGLVLVIGFASCKNSEQPTNNDKKMASIKKEVYGKTLDSQEVSLFILENANGMIVKITNYGGTITSILFPDKQGKIEDVVLGYKDFSGYLDKGNPFFGCLVGRFANRIAKGKFKLDGVEYKLAINNGPNSLHGGLKGFDKVVWEAKEISDSISTGLELSYLSKDGEEGYPGNFLAKVIYTLTNNDELKIEYFAETDKSTPINLTNHTYFNLTGDAKRDILDHEIKIEATKFTPVAEDLIPTGELKEVKETPFDFSELKKIGKDMAATGAGYDHNYVVNEGKTGIQKIAEVIENESKRKLEVFTDQIGVQFYTGNFLDGTVIGREGKPYSKHFGFCLETQHFPDSPNQPNFPSCILKPGEKFNQTTIYKFSIAQ